MAPTYPDHIDSALRYAALALSAPTPPADDVMAIRRLHDDLVLTLREATQLVCLSAFGEPAAERSRAGIHAGQSMERILETYPRLGTRRSDEAPPSQRWSRRPASPAHAVGALDAWKGLAAETFLARSCLDQMRRRFTSPIRAAVLNDLAVTADALATGTIDLAGVTARPRASARDRGAREIGEFVRNRAQDLHSAAAQVQADTTPRSRAHGTTMPEASAARNPWAVQPIRTPQDIPAAVENLGPLLRAGRPRVAELFSVAIVLGVIADATAKALDDSGSGGPEPAAASHALHAYRAEMALLLRTHQRRLASLGPGNLAALAQARELRSTGVPKLQRAAQAPPRGAEALPDPHATARALEAATRALASALAAARDRNEVLVHDRTRPIEKQWQAAAAHDVAPVLEALDRAAQAARAGAGRDAPEPVQGATVRESRGPVLDLAQALDRRRANLDRGPVGDAGRVSASAPAMPAFPPRGSGVRTHSRR